MKGKIEKYTDGTPEVSKVIGKTRAGKPVIKAKPITPAYKDSSKIQGGTGGNMLGSSSGTKVSKDYTSNANKSSFDNSSLYNKENKDYKASTTKTIAKFSKGSKKIKSIHSDKIKK